MATNQEYTARTFSEHDNDRSLELEQRESLFRSNAQWFYLACRSVGFAESNGSFFRGESEVSPEALFTKKYGPIDDVDDLLSASTNERGIADERQKVAARRELLEKADVDQEHDTPRMTICVPIAINSETPEMLTSLLQKVSKGQEDFDDSLQVILWANTNTDTAESRSQAQSNYDALKELAAQYDHPQLQIQTALDIIPSEDFSMSKLRQRFMDAFVGLAMDEDYTTDHVVTWLDADAAMIGQDYFGKLYDQTHKDEVGFVHPRVDYIADWAVGQNKSTYDDATRAFLANEIINRTMRNEDTPELYEYTEESGLTFTYLTFLLSGGCDTNNPVDESESLMNGLRTAESMAVFTALQELHTDTIETDLDVSRPYDKEVREAHMALSGRRIYETIKHYGVAALPTDRNGGAITPNYQLFSHLGNESEQPLDPAAVEQHLETRKRQDLKSELSRTAIDRVIGNLYPK